MSEIPPTSRPEPAVAFDRRFSDPSATPASWALVRQALEDAELYWLTTVRADGRPHVTPLVGVAVDGVIHFVTGLGEQKARNLEQRRHLALTTGVNTWAKGMDVVVEGVADRVTDRAALRRIADAFDAKYGGAWHFDVGDGVLQVGPEADGAVFRIEPSKVLAFAKDPHGQTAFRFG
jgi:hypothetical protein